MLFFVIVAVLLAFVAISLWSISFTCNTIIHSFLVLFSIWEYGQPDNLLIDHIVRFNCLVLLCFIKSLDVKEFFMVMHAFESVSWLNRLFNL